MAIWIFWCRCRNNTPCFTNEYLTQTFKMRQKYRCALLYWLLAIHSKHSIKYLCETIDLIQDILDSVREKGEFWIKYYFTSYHFQVMNHRTCAPSNDEPGERVTGDFPYFIISYDISLIYPQ